MAFTTARAFLQWMSHGFKGDLLVSTSKTQASVDPALRTVSKLVKNIKIASYCS